MGVAFKVASGEIYFYRKIWVPVRKRNRLNRWTNSGNYLVHP